jgi:hypothetical protein
LRAAQAREGEDGQAERERVRLQRVRPGAGLVGNAEDSGNRVAAGEEGFENGFTELLLADEGDAGDGGAPWEMTRG